MDVVIVTLLRPSLQYTLKSVAETIPDPNIILVTDKGVTGDLRNKGLKQCHSEYVCFVDDDVVLNQSWYNKCMKRLEEDNSIIAVSGRLREAYTCGCMICRTKEFKDAGGFPRMETLLWKKYGNRVVTLEDAVCDHIVPPGSLIRRQFRFLTTGFQTESKIGVNNSPPESLKLMIRFLKSKKPEFAIIQLLWIVKALFTLPFILSNKQSRIGS